jgi:hypothetical protein
MSPPRRPALLTPPCALHERRHGMKVRNNPGAGICQVSGNDGMRDHPRPIHCPAVAIASFAGADMALRREDLTIR